MAFVKFLQGTRAQFNALASKDVHTLYFVTGDDASVVSLYLGDRLISSIDSLSDLKDVVLETVADKDVLMYDSASEKWKNVSFETLISDIETSIEHQHINVDTNVFELTDDNVLKLVGFESAEAGATLSKTADGKVAWTIPTVDLSELANAVNALDEDLTKAEERIGTLESDVQLKANSADVYTKTAVNAVLDLKANAADVYTKDEVENVVNEALVAVDHLSRIIVNSVEEINVNAEDALKYIYMVPTGTVYGDDKYDEYLVIDDDGTRKVERVGSWEIDLSDYAKKATTLAGYGIADAYTKAETDKAIADKVADVTGGESAAAVKLALEAEVTRSTTKDTAHDTAIQALEDKMATIANGAEVNVIQTVDPKEFNLSAERHLTIKEIAASKITGLSQHEALTALSNAINSNTTSINSITESLNSYVPRTEYEAAIADLTDAVTWHNI